MTLRYVPLLAVLSVFTTADFAGAEDTPAVAVRDEVNLFSPEVRQKATELIAEIRDIYHFDFVVETVAAPPEDMRKPVAAMKTAAAVQYFKTWGAQRAEASGVNGVYVLICVDPGTVQVTVRPESAAQTFTAYDARRLQSRLKSMKKGPENVKQRDAKLLAALDQVRDELRYNMRPPFPMLAVGGVMAGALGLWGVLGLVRLRLLAKTPPAGSADSRLLSLQNGMLGGMFGNVAGHWIYDTLFIAASGSSRAPTTSPAAAIEPAATEAANDSVVPTPEQAKAERMDLNARDHVTEEETARRNLRGYESVLH